MTIFKFAMKRSLRSPINLLLLGVLPLAAIFAPIELWTSVPSGRQLFGVMLFFAASRLIQPVLDDRLNRTLTRIAAAPVTHLHYLRQHLLAYSLLLLSECFVFVVGAAIVHGTGPAASVLHFIVYAFYSASSLAFALAWSSLFRS